MPANTNMIFPLTPNIDSVLITAANTSSAGGGTVGTDIFKGFTAGANGSFVSSIRWIPVATTPTTMTATVGRVFISSVTSGATSSTNTWLIAEITLTALAADNASAAVPYFEIPFNKGLETGLFLHFTNHASPAANTNWRVVVFGGDY